MDKINFYSITQISSILGLSRIAVYKKVKKGEIKASRIGRNFAIAKNELENILGHNLNSSQKTIINEGVKKTVKEYGEVLKKLGNE